jgi:hypothetical protein
VARQNITGVDGGVVRQCTCGMHYCVGKSKVKGGEYVSVCDWMTEKEWCETKKVVLRRTGFEPAPPKRSEP